MKNKIFLRGNFAVDVIIGLFNFSKWGGPIYLIGCLILSIIYYIYSMLLSVKIITEFNQTAQSMDIVNIHTVLVTYYLLIKTLVDISVLILYLPIGFFGFLLTLVLINVFSIIYQFMIKEPPVLMKRHMQYDNLFKKGLKRELRFIFILTFASFAIPYSIITLSRPSQIVFSEPYISSTLDFLYLLLIVYLLILFVLIWTSMIKVRNNRKQKGRLDKYLFSTQSTKIRIKESFQLMIFLLSIGWFVFPIVGSTTNFIESYASNRLITQLGYKYYWEQIEKLGYSPEAKTLYNDFQLPSPDNIREYLSPEWERFIDSNYPKVFPKLQKILFQLLVIYLFLSVSIPSIANAIIFNSNRKMIIYFLMVTIKSFSILFLLQLIIEKGFLINTSPSFGWVTLYLFIISYFLNRQSILTKAEIE